MTQLLTDNEISTVVHDIDCGEVRPFDIEFARAIESAVLAKLREQNEPVALPFAILDEELQDLHRFHECVTDCVWFNKDGDVCSRWPNVSPPTHWMPLLKPVFTHPAPIPEGWISVDVAIPDAEVSVLVARLGRVNAQITCHTGKEWLLESSHYPVTHWRVIPRTPEQQALLERLHEGCLKSLAAARSGE